MAEAHHAARRDDMATADRGVLTARAGDFKPSRATASYAWLREGRLIPKATNRRYTVRPSDTGRSPVVRDLRPGIKPVVVRYARTELVQATVSRTKVEVRARRE